MSSPAFKPFALLPLLLAVVMTCHAQPAQPLPDWEQLSTAQREQLTIPIRDRWNSATPEQRTRMLSRAERWQQMAPDERTRISSAIGRWQNLPPGKHHELRALFHYLRGLDKPEREAFLTHWKSMTDAQRQSWAEANPAPPRQRHAKPPEGTD